MKTLIATLLLLSVPCFAQEYSEQKMYQKTAEAIAKFYGLDVIGEETLKRIQERTLPKEYHKYIPYFGTLGSIVIHNRIVYRREF